MLFNSGRFMVFFPIVVLAYYILPAKVKNYWLLFASYFFYMCWNAKYALLLFSSTFVTYIGALIIERLKKTDFKTSKIKMLQKATLILSLLINLGILFYFKYINFMFELLGYCASGLHISLNVPTFDIILPVGISFYIFQALGYLADVYRDDIYAEKNLFKYALFVSFFPQLVAGPIERSKNLLKQLDVPNKFDMGTVKEGLLTMLWGFFLKLVIAERCAVLVNTVYGEPDNYHGFQIMFASVMFAIQIYCDFMGYSIIAKGTAKTLGINITDNFMQPYFATSIKDFWRRWHISLSTWFRDYVYFPLGGSRCSVIKKYRNLFVTFLISGLWHGASLTFVVWGIIHGLYQIIEDIFKPVSEKLQNLCTKKSAASLLKALRVIKTFILVDIAWVFFRAESFDEALKIISLSLKSNNTGIAPGTALTEMGLSSFHMVVLGLALIILLVAGLLKEKGKILRSWIDGKHIVLRYAMYWSAVIMIILSLDIVGQEFIYFQF